MKILSLFDGMSVAQQAVKELGIIPEYYASEIDSYAIAVTQANHPETTQFGSVVELSVKSGEFDLLIGGSPCQDLSIAKKDRKGLEGERSGLFYEYLRIRGEAKPKFFVLENVASMPKEARDLISKSLGVEPILINANLVSAQNRKRLFWIGKLIGDKYEQVEIPQPEDKGIFLKDILDPKIKEGLFVKDKSNTIRTSGRGSGINDKHNWDMIQISGVAIRQTPRGKNKGGIKALDGKTPTLSASSWEDNNHLIQNGEVRKLTPLECLRLQSMPDDYFDKATYKGKSISNAQRYKMCGNAFNKEVIKHILKHL